MIVNNMKLYLLLLMCYSVFGADTNLLIDNKYFNFLLPEKWTVEEIAGKDGEMMLSVHEDNYGEKKTVAYIFANWGDLDPNHYLLGDFINYNGTKWVLNKDPNGKLQWWGIKSGEKYILSFSLAEGINSGNPVYISVLNTIVSK